MAAGQPRVLGGRFELLGELGRGGMGVVYRALDRTTAREVALKLVSQPFLDAESRARFQREGQLTAALRHPGIVGVHSAGEVEGRPFLAYELVASARTLDRAFEGLALAARVRLVRDAARALGHAHGRGVVHRDVKPANVLVDAAGQVRVADFGLATATGLGRLTQTGEVLGTPAFMAPEQLQGAGGVGAPADVWALGVILYRALTGEPPFAGRTFVEVAARVLEGAPPRPPRALAPAAPPALEAVCLQALSLDPAARPRDGEELARQLDLALRRQAPRRRTARALGASAALGLVLVLAATALLTRASQESHDEAPPVVEAAASRPRADGAGVAPSTTGAELAAASEAWLGSAPLARDLSDSRLAVEALLGDPWLKHTASIRALAATPDAVLAGDDHGVIRSWSRDSSERGTVATAAAEAPLVALAWGTSSLVLVASDGKVEYRSPASEFALALPHPAPTLAVAVSRDDRWVVTGGADRVLRVWDLLDQQCVMEAEHPTPVTAVAISDDGDAVLAGTEDGVLALWSIGARKRVSHVVLTGSGAVQRIAFAPGRARAAASLAGGAFAVVDLASNAARPRRGLTGPPLALAFSASGERLTAISAAEVGVWEVASLELVARHPLPRPAVAAALAPDGHRAFVGLAGEPLVREVDIERGELAAPSPGHVASVTGVAAVDDAVWTVSLDGTLRRWGPDGPGEVVQTSGAPLRAIASASDGSFVVAGDDCLYVLEPGAPPHRFTELLTPLGAAAAEPGRWWVGSSAGALANLTSVGGGRPAVFERSAHAGPLLGLVARGGGRVVSWGHASDGASLAVWDGASASPVARHPTVSGPAGAIAALPGTPVMVHGDGEGGLRWFDVDAGHEVRALERAHARDVTCLAVSPDARLLASGGLDRTLRLADAATGELIEQVPLSTSLDVPTAMTFTPDGRTLLVGFGSGVVARLKVEVDRPR